MEGRRGDNAPDPASGVRAPRPDVSPELSGRCQRHPRLRCNIDVGKIDMRIAARYPILTLERSRLRRWREMRVPDAGSVAAGM
jgi:hypothetical protein